MEACSFNPNLSKSQKKCKGEATYCPNYYATGRLPASPSAAALQSERGQSSAMSSTTGRGGESFCYRQPRHDQLHQLSYAKAQNRREISARSFEERDFEAQKTECTFQPKMVAKYAPAAQKFLNPPATKPDRQWDIQKIFRDKTAAQGLQQNQGESGQVQSDRSTAVEKMKIWQKLDQLRQKSVEMDVQRKKMAQQEREYIKQCLERGVPPKQAQRGHDRKSTERSAPAVTKEVIQLPNTQPAAPVTTVKPLLYIDIAVGAGKKERITVYPKDDPHVLATDFCKKHQFGEDTLKTLEAQLIEKISNVESAKK